jgi:hypothetical protein
MDAVSRTIDVPPFTPVLRADLAIPSGRTFAVSLCGTTRDSVGAVIGRVFNASTDAPVQEGIVTVRWGEMAIAAGNVGRTMRQTTVKFGADGRYVVCNVPLGAPILVSARAGTGPAATSPGVSSEIELTFAANNPLVHRNLLIQMKESAGVATDVIAAAASDTSSGTMPASTPPPATVARPTIARTGTARLAGRVVAGDGKPVNGARVHIVDTDVTATTDTSGAFRLIGLPAGTRALEVTAIGFQPVRTGADLRPNRDATMTINVGPRIATLASVDVTAPKDKAGYYQRRARGLGHFLDGNTIEQRGALNISQALLSVPTLRGNGFDRNNPTRPLISGRSNCRPTAYLDGLQMQDGMAGIDDALTVRRVGAVEVYANPTEAPPQFRAQGNCAVILVWTRAYVP